MENKQSWQDEAIKGSGIQVPDWKLEGEETPTEAVNETTPSVAEARLEEIAAGAKEVTPENSAEPEGNIARVREEIASIVTPKPTSEDIGQNAKTIKSQEGVNIEDVNFAIPSLEDSLGRSIHAYDLRNMSIKEASGGLIEYVPNSKQSERGYEFEGKGKIPLEKLEELKLNLEVAENKKSKEAFDYVKVPDKAWGSKWTKGLTVNDGKSFSSALDAKSMHNDDVRKKIWLGSVYASAVAMTAGMATMAIGGTGTATALIGAGIIGIGGGAFLGIGALGWMGKRIYDSYQEKKAAKNFITASVAQNMRRSL